MEVAKAKDLFIQIVFMATLSAHKRISYALHNVYVMQRIS